MPRHRLQQGMHLELRGREYVIEKRLPTGELRLRDVITDNPVIVTDAQLHDAFASRDLRFLGDRSITVAARRAAEQYVADITALEDDDARKREMHRRYAYVKAVMALNLKAASRPVIESAVRQVHAEIRDGAANPPNWQVVYYRWLKWYLDSGEDVRSLVPRYRNRGNHKRKFTGARKQKGSTYSKRDLELAGQLAEIVKEVVETKYLTLQRLSVNEVYNSLLVRIHEENLTRDRCDRLPVPSARAVHYHVSKLDRYEVVKGREGKRIADIQFRAYVKGVTVSRPLERVELDATDLDLLVIDDETGLPVGRPKFTVAIDAYTKMVLGFHVSFDGEGALSILRCLVHAILPKTYLRDEYPDVKHDWEAYGLPEVLVVDNGSGQHSTHLEDACLQLGISVQHCPVRNPWFKGTVERYLETQNTLFLHGLPGTTFSNVLDRGDYDAAKHSIVSFKTLMTILHKFVADFYQNRPHDGINDVPARLWGESIKENPPAWAPHRDELQILAGHLKLRCVHPYGVEILGGLKYNDPALAALRRRYDQGRKFKVKYDPSNLGVIHVLDPESDRYIAVPSTNPAYASGLTLYQHKITRRFLKKRAKKASDPTELALAKEEISRIIERDWNHVKKIGPRKRMGRFKNIAQPRHGAPKGAGPGGGRGPLLPPAPPVAPAPAAALPAGPSEIGSAVSFVAEDFVVGAPPPAAAVAQQQGDAGRARRTRKAKNGSPAGNGGQEVATPPARAEWGDDDSDLDTSGWEADTLPA